MSRLLLVLSFVAAAHTASASQFVRRLALMRPVAAFTTVAKNFTPTVARPLTTPMATPVVTRKPAFNASLASYALLGAMTGGTVLAMSPIQADEAKDWSKAPDINGFVKTIRHLPADEKRPSRYEIQLLDTGLVTYTSTKEEAMYEVISSHLSDCSFFGCHLTVSKMVEIIEQSKMSKEVMQNRIQSERKSINYLSSLQSQRIHTSFWPKAGLSDKEIIQTKKRIIEALHICLNK